MPRWPNKTNPTPSDDVGQTQSPTFDIASLTQGGPDIIEAPADLDMRKLFENEAFLNEKIEIRCKANGDMNAPKAVEISVQTGGITGPMGPVTPDHPEGTPGKAGRGGKLVKYVFQYDRTYPVPRFVFEALAHAKTTALRQVPSQNDPLKMMQQNINTFYYNFECVRDTNPQGQAWREKVLRDAA